MADELAFTADQIDTLRAATQPQFHNALSKVIDSFQLPFFISKQQILDQVPEVLAKFFADLE